jgi:plasminogen activator inhibitor 1 RNA-binding protein
LANNEWQAAALATPVSVMIVYPDMAARGKHRLQSPLHNDTNANTLFSGSDKQAAASWGATEGEAELKDEQAGEAIAKSEQKEALVEDAAAEEPAEPEDKSVSYSDYLAQQAEKKLALDDGLKLRSANEGSKLDKKWQNATALENEEEDYFAGGGGKKQRERERKVKQTIDFDPRFVEPERTRGGGGRGGPRGGGRGRGEGRGGRGGNFRGGRGGRENAAPASASAAINTKDESAFPSLGGK